MIGAVVGGKEMIVRLGTALLGTALLFVAGAQAADKPLFLLPLMKDVIAPQAQALWDVGNRAYDDDGTPDVSHLSAADWTKLTNAAKAMKAASQAMANAPGIHIAPAGAQLQDQDAPGQATAKQIQAFIDANPSDFADRARALVDVSDAFLKASQAKHVPTLADASGRLDEVCEACHVRYWYPQ